MFKIKQYWNLLAIKKAPHLPKPNLFKVLYVLNNTHMQSMHLPCY